LLWFHLFQFASLASVVQLLLQFMHELCICIAGSTDFFVLEALQHVNGYLRILVWSSNVLQRCFCSILIRFLFVTWTSIYRIALSLASTFVNNLIIVQMHLSIITLHGCVCIRH
jgi:hypothetical protein